MIRPSVLLLALAMSSPALYRAFVTQEMDVQAALLRFLLAVGAAAVMMAALRFFTAGYGDKGPASRLPLRRHTDPQETAIQPAGDP